MEEIHSIYRQRIEESQKTWFIKEMNRQAKSKGEMYVPQNHLLISLSIIFMLFLCIPPLFSQDREKVIHVSRTESPPKIDGLIEDACWTNIQPVSGFFQFDPYNGEKASEETLVWAAYDQKYIYLAFLMKDAHPEQIWAELTQRNAYQNNDSLKVILDTKPDMGNKL
jgi:hypothetical protein